MAGVDLSAVMAELEASFALVRSDLDDGAGPRRRRSLAAPLGRRPSCRASTAGSARGRAVAAGDSLQKPPAMERAAGARFHPRCARAACDDYGRRLMDSATSWSATLRTSSAAFFSGRSLGLWIATVIAAPGRAQ